MKYVWMIISVVGGMLFCLMLSGCSAGVSLEGDAFYPKNKEPRSQMPWYGSVAGKSNRNGGTAASMGFGRMGGE